MSAPRARQSCRTSRLSAMARAVYSPYFKVRQASSQALRQEPRAALVLPSAPAAVALPSALHWLVVAVVPRWWGRRSTRDPPPQGRGLPTSDPDADVHLGPVGRINAALGESHCLRFLAMAKDLEIALTAGCGNAFQPGQPACQRMHRCALPPLSSATVALRLPARGAGHAAERQPAFQTPPLGSSRWPGARCLASPPGTDAREVWTGERYGRTGLPVGPSV
jgi:hypothetical protein